MDIIIRYLDQIKLGDFIYLRSQDQRCFNVCKVTKIYKGKRHSREDGYPYTFTGEAEDGRVYTETYYRNVRKYINLERHN
jgi:hypothetical protein